MFERTVRLPDRDSVSEFVKAAAECSFNVDVCYTALLSMESRFLASSAWT